MYIAVYELSEKSRVWMDVARDSEMVRCADRTFPFIPGMESKEDRNF